MSVTDGSINAWSEFEKRANKFLKNDSKGKPYSKKSKPHHLDLDTPWGLNRGRAWMISRMDLESKLHKKNSKYQCEIMVTEGNKDDLICDIVSRDITMLYDPCVAERIWIARNGEDQKFLKALGKVIANYKINSIKKVSRDNRHDTRFLRLFIVELNRRGIFDFEGLLWEDCAKKSCRHRKGSLNCLRGIPQEVYLKNEFKNAHTLIKDLVNQNEPIKDILSLVYLQDSGKFQKWCKTILEKRTQQAEGDEDYRPWE